MIQAPLTSSIFAILYLWSTLGSISITLELPPPPPPLLLEDPEFPLDDNLLVSSSIVCPDSLRFLISLRIYSHLFIFIMVAGHCLPVTS